MNGNDQNGDYQLFGEHLEPPEPLELSLEPDLGYPRPDPPFKATLVVQWYLGPKIRPPS